MHACMYTHINAYLDSVVAQGQALHKFINNGTNLRERTYFYIHKHMHACIHTNMHTLTLWSPREKLVTSLSTTARIWERESTSDGVKGSEDTRTMASVRSWCLNILYLCVYVGVWVCRYLICVCDVWTSRMYVWVCAYFWCMRIYIIYIHTYIYICIHTHAHSTNHTWPLWRTVWSARGQRGFPPIVVSHPWAVTAPKALMRARIL